MVAATPVVAKAAAKVEAAMVVRGAREALKVAKVAEVEALVAEALMEAAEGAGGR